MSVNEESLEYCDVKPPFKLVEGKSDIDWDIVDSHAVGGSLGGTFNKGFGELIVKLLNDHYNTPGPVGNPRAVVGSSSVSSVPMPKD